MAHRLLLPSSAPGEEATPDRAAATPESPLHSIGLQLGVDVFVLLVKIGQVHNIAALGDVIAFVLADVAGLLKVNQTIVMRVHIILMRIIIIREEK